jgi:acyl-coenzyme A thioesterase PaaI-like protein
MNEQPFQDLVDWQCYGCGRLNPDGFQIKSHWEGDEVTCHWRPKPFHVGHPGRLQGGVIATAVICHAIWTATATAYRAEGREIREPLEYAYSTTSLKIDFLTPTPLDGVLTLRARVTGMGEGRATVLCSVFVDDKQTARAESQLARIFLGG